MAEPLILEAAAAHVKAPGLPTVTSVTAATASGEISCIAQRGGYISIGVDDGTLVGATVKPDYWVVFGVAGNVTTPNAINAMGPFNGIVALVPSVDQTAFRVITSGTGTHYVRHYQSSPQQ